MTVNTFFKLYHIQTWLQRNQFRFETRYVPHCCEKVLHIRKINTTKLINETWSKFMSRTISGVFFATNPLTMEAKLTSCSLTTIKAMRMLITAYYCKNCSNWVCNGRLLMSLMRLRKTGPITIGASVRNTVSCAFIPHSVGAHSVRVRHESTNRGTA